MYMLAFNMLCVKKKHWLGVNLCILLVFPSFKFLGEKSDWKQSGPWHC